MRSIPFLSLKPFRSYKPTKMGLSAQTQIHFFDKFRVYCSIIFWRILKIFTCFDIYWKRSFRWDQSRFCCFSRLGAIGPQRWNWLTHKSTFLINSEITVASFFWQILVKFTCFDIYWKISFGWDQSHFCRLSRLGAISRQIWVCGPKHKSTFCINSEFTVASFFDGFKTILHVLIAIEKNISDETNPIFVALAV